MPSSAQQLEATVSYCGDTHPSGTAGPAAIETARQRNGPYLYRVFATNHSGRAHQVVLHCDPRVAAEALIGEAQREEVLAIPSKRFQSHHAFFQIVMLTYKPVALDEVAGQSSRPSPADMVAGRQFGISVS